MKYFLLSALCLLLSHTTVGQDAIFNGKVVDSVNHPVEFANVILMDTSTQAIKGFAVTDTEGKFKIPANLGNTYQLKVSFIGYQTYKQVFQLSEELSEGLLIILRSGSEMLDEVQVVHEMPVVMSGDTLVYKTEAFTNGREQKLEDVLKKLPGIEVDDEGGVRVQGKKVNKLLVEGKQFFDGDTKMGVKNIPANAIEKVQVLNDFNEVGPLNGVNNSEEIALNIKLKPGKKNMIFGDATIAGGMEDRYLGHLNSFYYSNHLNINLIADANNIGKQAFTARDYYRFGGDMNSSKIMAGTEIDGNDNANNVGQADRFSANDLQNSLVALNFNYSPSKKWHHTGFLIGARARYNFLSDSYRRYLNNESEIDENLTSNEQNQNYSGLLKYSAQFSLNTKSYFKYSIFSKANQLDAQDQLLSFSRDTVNMLQSEQRENYSIHQRLEAYHSFNNENILSVMANLENSWRIPHLKINSEAIASMNLMGDSISGKSYLQRNREHNLYGNFKIDYYRVLNRLNHINLSLGNSQSLQSFKSELRSIQEGERSDQQVLGKGFQNDLQLKITDSYIGLSSKSKLNKLIIIPSLFLHRYQISSESVELSLEQNIYLLPSFKASYQISTPQKISFNYEQNVVFQNVDKYADGIRVTNYNQLLKGNNQLKEGLYHKFSLNYNYFNLFSGWNIYAQLNYDKQKRTLAEQIEFTRLSQEILFNNAPNYNERISAYGSFRKNFKKFKLGLNGNISYAQDQVFIAENWISNEILMTSTKLSGASTFFKVLELGLNYEVSMNTYQANTFINQAPGINIDWNVFKGLNIKSEYQWNKYSAMNSQLASTYDNLDLFIIYRPSGQSWEINFSAYNLLKTESIRRDNFYNNIISTQNIWIQARYITLGFRYNF